MENSILYNHKWYRILYCNNTIDSRKSISVVIDDFDQSMQTDIIIVYYNGKYYHSKSFEVVVKTRSFEQYSRSEIKIRNLVDITREHNINIILDE